MVPRALAIQVLRSVMGRPVRSGRVAPLSPINGDSIRSGFAVLVRLDGTRPDGIRLACRRECGARLATGLGIEAVAGEEGVGALPPLTGIGHPGERALVAGEEPPGRLQIDVDDLPAIIARAAGRPPAAGRSRAAGRATFLEELVDNRPIDAFQRQLPAQGDLAAWPGTVARLHPGAAERRVVEDAQLAEPGDRAFNEVRAIAGPPEPAADLRDGPRPSLEEPGGGIQDGRGVVDRGPLATPLLERLPGPPVGHLRRAS
jgi:hypothetical protein